MADLIYFEDRDTETGHGWRDVPHVLRTDGKDGHIKASLVWDGEESPYSSVYASCSYAWITTRASFEKNGLRAEDELRLKDVLDEHPGFQGGADMEGHFEFYMTPEEMQRHLRQLGIACGDSR